MPRVTRQRSAIAELLESTADFRSAQQLHAELSGRGESIGLATVYRTLQVLADSGTIDAIRADDGEIWYRQCRRPSHHHHLVCRQCGTAVEIGADEVEAWASQIAASHGFTSVEHTAEIFGLCATCSVRFQE